MRIAFDLDGTLIRCGYDFPVVGGLPGCVARCCGLEPLREGAIALMRFFQQQGEEVWVYTTSYRSPVYLRFLFLLHGIKLKGVVNQAVHDSQLKRLAKAPRCSKYPPAFGIDLLIDDQEGVLIEAQRHGFEVVWVKPQDENWAEQVKVAYRELKRIH